MEHLRHILFIDIETVSVTPDFDTLPEGLQGEWIRKAKNLKSSTEINADASTLYNDKAGIFSEFAKVVCICFGSLQLQDNKWHLRLKSLTNNDEKVLLNDFCTSLSRFEQFFPNFKFCGHNIREFDIPFLCRRMVINGMVLPQCMQLHGKKPWEVQVIEDTLELWRFGDYKNYTSLALLAEVLGIPSPKNDMDGSLVSDVYWKQKNLERIGKYCMQDVLTTARVYLRLKGIKDEGIIWE